MRKILAVVIVSCFAGVAMSYSGHVAPFVTPVEVQGGEHVMGTVNLGTASMSQLSDVETAISTADSYSRTGDANIVDAIESAETSAGVTGATAHADSLSLEIAVDLTTDAVDQAKAAAEVTGATAHADALDIVGAGVTDVIDTVQTGATGTDWAVFPTHVGYKCSVANNSGTVLTVRRGGAGVGYPIQDKGEHVFRGITNSNQLSIQRVDQGNTQVSAELEIESL